MKQLQELIKAIKTKQIIGSNDVLVDTLTIDSRKAGKGSLFFAQKGTLTDGHKYIDQVIEAGAVVIVCQDIPAVINESVTYIQVEDVAATAVPTIISSWAKSTYSL